jgi:hypothetical protein
MLARCAHCQQTFEPERFGVQGCPHCGQQVHLADPSAPPASPAAPIPPAGEPPPPGAVPPGAPAGAAPPPPPPPPYWMPGAPGTMPPVGEAPAPFAERSRLGWPRAWIDTWKLAALRPAEFFRSVRVDAPGSAVFFGVVAMTVASWFQTLYGAVMGAATRGMVQQMLHQVPQGDQLDNTWVLEWVGGSSVGGMVGQLVAAPFLSAAWILLTAAIYHAVLLVLRAAPRGFPATITVVGYASGVLVIGAAPVPLLANLVAMAWFAAVAAVGLREAQRTTSAKAWLAILLPFLLVCACCCAFFGTIASTLSHLQLRKG